MTASSAKITITTKPAKGRVVVRFGGTVIAESTRALSVQHDDDPPTYYIPRADSRMDLLERTALKTQCEYKGEASYFTVRAGGKSVENAVWSYEAPPAEHAAIAGLLAFYMMDSIDLL